MTKKILLDIVCLVFISVRAALKLKNVTLVKKGHLERGLSASAKQNILKIKTKKLLSARSAPKRVQGARIKIYAMAVSLLTEIKQISANA
jgi:hypothetical protein